MNDYYFIYSNLKVNPFVLADTPLPGFSVEEWNVTSTGILLEIDRGDVGYLSVGNRHVYGQLWKIESKMGLDLLEKFIGAKIGLTRQTLLDIIIETRDYRDHVQAVSYELTNINPTYKIVETGRWRF